MSDSSLLSVLGALAPDLIGLIPGGGLATDVLKTVSQAVLGHPAGSEDDVKAAIDKGLNGEQIAALAKANNDAKIAQGQQQVDLAKNDNDAQVAQLQTINATMQAELAKRQFSWRDFWGFLSAVAFGCVIGLCIYIAIEAVYTGHYELMANIPTIVGAFTVLFGIPMAVLGVQSTIEAHHAGMVDRINATKPDPEAVPAGGAPIKD